MKGRERPPGPIADLYHALKGVAKLERIEDDERA